MKSPALLDLAREQCAACSGDVPPLSEADLAAGLAQLSDWSVVAGELEKTFTFKNFHHTMAFVNAVAWVAHQANHHPTLEVGYRTCRIRWMTHAVKALTRADLVCAARVESLG